ncbi:hypothetical protein ACFLQI_03195 [Candidatus Undinarchaeota archaeon]
MKNYLLSELRKHRCSDIEKIQDILDTVFIDIKNCESDEDAKSCFLDALQRLQYERQAYDEILPVLKEIYKSSKNSEQPVSKAPF